MIDYIGHYGPTITFLIGCYALLNRTIYLMTFVFGSFVNVFVNFYLKDVFREPRPERPIKFLDSGTLIGNNYYGMPSGHAQCVAYVAAFLYLAKVRVEFVCIIIAVLILTVYQRWKYRRHTIMQLIMGSIIGGLFAWMVISLTRYQIEL